MRPYFLNVDLEVVSKSKSGLDFLVADMGKRVMILHVGPAAGRRHLLALEIRGQHKGPDATIHALCDVVERLSPASRRIWDAARKEFDVGFELRCTERSSRFTLRPDTLQRIAGFGANLAVTYYRGENDHV